MRSRMVPRTSSEHTNIIRDNTFRFEFGSGFESSLAAPESMSNVMQRAFGVTNTSHMQNDILGEVVSRALQSARTSYPIVRQNDRRIQPEWMSNQADRVESKHEAQHSQHLRQLSRQVIRAIEDVKNAIIPFSNAVSHMPDIGNGDSVTIELFVSMLSRITFISQHLATSESKWKEEWNVFFQSMQNATSMQVSDCCVCMEQHPTINVCGNSEQAHLLCATCLLSHYWISTEECTRSFATCPLCRAPINLTEIVGRLSSLT